MKPWRNVTSRRRVEHNGKPAIINVLDCGHSITFGGGTEILAKARIAERRRCFMCPDEEPPPKTKRRSAPRSYLIDPDFI